METIRQSLVSVEQQLNSLTKKEREITTFLEKVGEKDLDTVLMKWKQMSDDSKKTQDLLDEFGKSSLPEMMEEWQTYDEKYGTYVHTSEDLAFFEKYDSLPEQKSPDDTIKICNTKIRMLGERIAEKIHIDKSKIAIRSDISDKYGYRIYFPGYGVMKCFNGSIKVLSCCKNIPYKYKKTIHRELKELVHTNTIYLTSKKKSKYIRQYKFLKKVQ